MCEVQNPLIDVGHLPEGFWGAEPTAVVGHLLGSYPNLEIAMIIVIAEKTKITINCNP